VEPFQFFPITGAITIDVWSFLTPIPGRVIVHEKALFRKSGCSSTHPDIATLVDPLFSFAGKRVMKKFVIAIALSFLLAMTFFLIFLNPSFRRRRREGGPAQRRPGE
jgi:hypothetical protein